MKRRRKRTTAAILVLLVLGIAGSAPAGSATAAPLARSSIVGGAPADPAQWPFAAAIFRKGRMHCSGAVISPTRVLTAAHCLDGFNLANLQVITGRPDLRNVTAGQAIPVASGRIHPDYEQTGLHDVGVINLASPTTAPPVALATPDQNAAVTGVGAQLQVAGFGATSPYGVRLSPVLKFTFELVRTDNRCLRAYSRDLFAPDSMICALGARRQQGGKFKIHTSACSGDSGGPLVAQTATGPVEVGTVSFGGALCGLAGAPTVYSRVSSSLDFINAP